MLCPDRNRQPGVLIQYFLSSICKAFVHLLYYTPDCLPEQEGGRLQLYKVYGEVCLPGMQAIIFVENDRFSDNDRKLFLLQKTFLSGSTGF
jgi:hypothetical protein